MAPLLAGFAAAAWAFAGFLARWRLTRTLIQPRPFFCLLWWTFTTVPANQ